MKQQLFFLFVQIGTWSLLCSAGITLTHDIALRGEGAILERTNLDVIVAKITSVPNQTGTNENPPKFSFKVIETL